MPNATHLVTLWTLLAQAEPAAADPAAPSPFGFLPAILILIALFYFMMIRPERQKQAAHKALLEGLKKNDRVVTIGGIYGVVMNVARDADEVTIKVDETTNTKIRVTFGAVARVVTGEPTGDKPA